MIMNDGSAKRRSKAGLLIFNSAVRPRPTTDLQIWVAAEENTKHVPHLSFIPIGTSEKTSEGRYWRNLVGVCLYSDSVVVQVGQHVVDDLQRRTDRD
jgi:hypothetical protein